MSFHWRRKKRQLKKYFWTLFAIMVPVAAISILMYVLAALSSD